MDTSDAEQQALQQLKKYFSTVDELRSRVDAPERLLKPAAGTVLAEDDRLSHPFRVSHAAASALMVAVDHLQALRRMTEGCHTCDPNGMTFQITAHWALLRAVLENACRAIWLLGPEDRSERVTRALRLQADNVEKSDAAFQKMPSGPKKPKAERRARVKEIATNAGLSPGKAVEKVGYRMIVRYAGDFVEREPDRFEFLWCACSAAAHGDTWAIMSLQEQEPINSADGIATIQLTASIPGLSMVTGEVVALVEAAFGLFDHRDQPPE